MIYFEHYLREGGVTSLSTVVILVPADGEGAARDVAAELRDLFPQAPVQVAAEDGAAPACDLLVSVFTQTDRVAHMFYRFLDPTHPRYDAVLAADMPATTRLAETIQTWWPAILAFLQLRVTNARRRQQDHQTTEASRLRLPESSQLRTPYRPARRRQERGVTAINEESLTLEREEPAFPYCANGSCSPEPAGHRDGPPFLCQSR